MENRKLIFTMDDCGLCVIFEDQLLAGMRFKPAGRGDTIEEMVQNLYVNEVKRMQGDL